MPRYLALLLPVVLVAFVGCAPSKGDIEKSIRDEMKSSLGLEIASINLEKQSDGSYSGTATASNGDSYDIVTDPPKRGKTEWKAIPSQATIEKMFRTDIESKTKSKVESLNLKRESIGVYNGTAKLDSGLKLKLSTTLEGKNVHMKFEPMFGDD